MNDEKEQKLPLASRLRWALKHNFGGRVLWLHSSNESNEQDSVQKSIENLVGSENFILIDDEVSCYAYLNQHDNNYFLVVPVTASEALRRRADHVHDRNAGDEYGLYDKLLNKSKAINNDEEQPMFMRIQTTQDIQNEQLTLNAHEVDAIVDENPSTAVVPQETSSRKSEQHRRFMFDFSGEPAGFTEFQLWIECLAQINDQQTALIDMLSICRSRTNDPNDLAVIDEFEQTYRSEQAIWWYSRDSCIYKQLNRTLLDGDVHSLFAYRLLIGDIYRQLSKMFSEQTFPNPLLVYRGRRMPQDQINSLQRLVGGGLACMTSFNSTSTDRRVAETFAGRCANSVLFEMSIDQSKLNKPMADISTMSQFNDEKELLLFVGTVFRVVSVEHDEHRSQPWLIKLELADETEEFKRALRNSRTMCENGMYSYAYILHHFDRQADASIYWRRLLDMYRENDLEVARFHRFLSEYHLAIEHLERALDTKQFPCTVLLKMYDELALCQREMGNTSGAMQTYNMILKLLEEDNDRTKLANLYHDIAQLLSSKDPKAALEYCQRALNLVSNNDTDFITELYTLLGVLFVTLQDFERGLTVFMYACKILEGEEMTLDRSCKLANFYAYIASILLKFEKFDEALIQAQRSVTQLRSYLPDIHGSVSYAIKIVGDIFLELGDYTTALDNYKKALISPSLYVLGLLHCNIARAHAGLNEISQAEEHFRLAVAHSQKSRELPNVYCMFCNFYESQGRFDLALEQRQLALDAEYQFQGRADQASHSALASFFSRQGSYAKAVEHAERDIQLLDTQPDSNLTLSSWLRLSAAMHHRRNGRLDRALERTMEAFKLIGNLDEQQNGELVAGACNTLAMILFDQGSFTEALNWVQRAIDANLTNCSYLFLSHYIFALIYDAQGKYNLALTECYRALRLKVPVNPAADPFPMRTRVYELMGDIYTEQNKFAKAQYWFKLVNVIRHSLFFPSHHPDHARTQQALARLNIRQGMLEYANKRLQKAIAIQEVSLHNEHPDIGRSYALLAECDLQRGAEYLDRAAHIFARSLPNTHPTVLILKQRLSELTLHEKN